MAHGNSEMQISTVEATSSAPRPAPRGFVSFLGAIFGPIGTVLVHLRDLAAAAPDAKSGSEGDRPYLDTIAFREVLPLLEEHHLLLSEIKDLSRRTEDTDPDRLADLQRQHEERLPDLLGQLEKASMCVHSRCHHHIRDMLENVVLFDSFINDFYLRNICNTMNEAIEKAKSDI